MADGATGGGAGDRRRRAAASGRPGIGHRRLPRTAFFRFDLPRRKRRVELSRKDDREVYAAPILLDRFYGFLDKPNFAFIFRKMRARVLVSSRVVRVVAVPADGHLARSAFVFWTPRIRTESTQPTSQGKRSVLCSKERAELNYVSRKTHFNSLTGVRLFRRL